jgi:iron complex transport system permease protein
VADFIGARSTRRLTARYLALVLGGFAAVAAVAVVLATLVSSETAPGGRRLTLLDLGAVFRGGNDDADLFWMIRLPRVLAGMLVGGALAAAGCAFQAVLRNPLADPFTLGISSGSSLAAVIAIRLGLDGALGGTGVGIAAFAGAAAAVFLVWRLGRVGGTLPPALLVLAGITIAMFCGATSMLVQFTADFAEVSRMLRWMMGSLDWMPYRTVGSAAIPIAIGLVVLLSQARALNALAAGDDAAASVGVNVGRSLATTFAVAAIIVGASIAVAGPIGFLGLMVPHALRALLGADHRLLMPASILAGGTMLVICDAVARLALAPAQLPVGVVTAMLGGPSFLIIMMRYKRGLRT